MVKILDLNFQGKSHAIASFLIETGEGPVIIETGPHSTLPFLEKGLGDAGYKLSDVRHVFLSHIHLDHAGAAWALAEAGATVYVHPIGAPHMIDPSRLMKSAKMIYQEQMDSLWGEMRPIATSQIREVAHGEIFRIGDVAFTAHHTPGHAIHHIAWQMGDAVFTGDVAGVKIGENGLVVAPCPPPDINIEQWKDSIALVRRLNPNKLYLTHFGEISAIDQHFNDLIHCLESWANWIKPHWENGETPEAVTPAFEAFARQQLLDAGLPADDVARYDAANPAWMSVAGLMRYWRKRSEK